MGNLFKEQELTIALVLPDELKALAAEVEKSNPEGAEGASYAALVAIENSQERETRARPIKMEKGDYGQRKPPEASTETRPDSERAASERMPGLCPGYYPCSCTPFTKLLVGLRNQANICQRGCYQVYEGSGEEELHDVCGIPGVSQERKSWRAHYRGEKPWVAHYTVEPVGGPGQGAPSLTIENSGV